MKESKWWPHFTAFCSKTKLEDEQICDFIDNLFDTWEEDEKLYPFVLLQEHGSMAEKRVLGKSDIETEELSENDYINLTLKKVSAWAKQNSIFNNKLGRFLTDRTCIIRALRGEYYKPIFLFCSDFLNSYGPLNEEDILKKNSIRAFHQNLYGTLKIALKEKFVD